MANLTFARNEEVVKEEVMRPDYAEENEDTCDGWTAFWHAAWCDEQDSAASQRNADKRNDAYKEFNRMLNEANKKFNDENKAKAAKINELMLQKMREENEMRLNDLKYR